CYLSYVAFPDPHSFPTRRSSDLPSTKETPFFLLHGRDARLPKTLDLDYNAVHFDSLDAYTQHLVQTLLQTFPRVRESLHSATSSDRKSTRLNSSHVKISYAVFCL